jgi:hypothetical protein
VLTGPDHLSALATLSANVGHVRQAFLLGIRWGIGHSTGLLAVAILLILCSRPDNEEDPIDVPARLSSLFEGVVGFFMIFLGIYGIRRAWIKRSDMYRIIPAVPAASDEEAQRSVPMQDVHSARLTDRSLVSIQERNNVSDVDTVSGSTDETLTEPKPTFLDQLMRCSVNISTQSMALLAGIVHGLAGPGGVLGVIPAVQLHNGRLAALYLSCFCISSTVMMGVFATFYGSCSSRLVDQRSQPFVSGNYHAGTREFRIECTSACFSIIVGILWLVLLSIGKLDDIFP